MFFINERKARLFNRKYVHEGDMVYFIDSDGDRREDIVRKRKTDCTHADTGETLKKGTLFFYNNMFKITDYVTADKC